jgi:Gluconate 2-dehydrogenase subunit 3
VAYDRRQPEVASPSEGGRPYRDYRVEIGRAEVPVGVKRDFRVLDPERAATLGAWVECLIPARGERPSAAQIGAAEYIDASVASAHSLRETLVRVIDRLQGLAAEGDTGEFAAADLDQRSLAVRALELEDRSGGFEMVRDFTYEAYYAHPLVLAALQREVGWDGVAPTRGSEMEAFDEGLLRRVRTLPPHYKEVG